VFILLILFSFIYSSHITKVVQSVYRSAVYLLQCDTLIVILCNYNDIIKEKPKKCLLRSEMYGNDKVISKVHLVLMYSMYMYIGSRYFLVTYTVELG
jgi:hypothetical protein